MTAHPTIEYLNTPGDYHRFGNRIFINSHHMRAEEHDEYDILVLGDSVIHGGSQTDQSELATTLLAEATGLRVANISAGSWGPPNLLAYVEEFGFFNAKHVILVLSSHDAADVPTFEPIVGVHPSFPDKAPPSALWEGVTRYLPRYLSIGGGGRATPTEKLQNHTNDRLRLEALGQLIEEASATGTRVVLIQHWMRDELAAGEPEPGHVRIAEVVESRFPGVRIHQTADAFRTATDYDGPSPYRDGIHPSTTGQVALFEVLREAMSGEP